ncbi:MAG TPA: hypothetical protein VF270_07980, partial [Ignavibacteriaceae bacterium]
MSLKLNKLLIIVFYLNLFSITPFASNELNPFPLSQKNNKPNGVHLSGFGTSPYYNEQICSFNFEPEIKVLINSSSVENFNPTNPTQLIIYALPNGNTIEQTIGKKLNPDDDWHYDIQHIGAQTRFLRKQLPDYNIVVIYLETLQKSWPLWKSEHRDYPVIIGSLINYLTNLFSNYNPSVVLTGHSGGGSFIFGYLDSVNEIADNIERISFLDSNYGYDEKYGNKILKWIQSSTDHYLSVIAYNDSVALYNGKPVVSSKGGTWFKSKMMQDFLDDYYDFSLDENKDFINYSALDGRIKFLLKKNPDRLILHTVQVELNGFIEGMLSGTNMESKGYTYYGERAYTQFIQTGKRFPKILMIPPRPLEAITGTQFIEKIMNMTFDQREKEIYYQLFIGNIPDFLRNLVTINSNFFDAEGKNHLCTYQVMPDYLAIGSNEDFCRIPMGPLTAQKIADLYGTILPTSKLVDDIYKHSEVKLEPVTYKPVGDENTLVTKFLKHNQDIEIQ